MHSSELAPTIRVLALDKIEAKIDYAVLIDAVKQVTAASKGSIVQEQPDQGFIEARFKSFMTFAGIRVRWQFLQLDSGEIGVEAIGQLLDAIDTFGAATKKAHEQVGALIEHLQEHQGATVQVPAAPLVSAPPRAISQPPHQRPVAPAYAHPAARSHSGMATWAFVCGLLGILTFGPIPGLLGIVFGAVARSNMYKSQNFDGRGMATAGLVLGIISTLLGGLLAWIFILAN